MKKHYEINNKLLKELLFDNLKMIAFLIIVLPFYWKWRNETEFVLDQQILIIISVIILIMNIPSLLIYLNYYFENKGTTFTLDFDSKKIEITQNGKTKTYTINDVSESTYHLGIYYKNAIDRAGRIPMLVSDFGYWDLKFKNGDRYFLTNILHDFIHNDPFFKNTKYRFRMFTYINKSDSKKTVELKQELKRKKEKSQTEKFVEKFKTKSETELNEILTNKSKYQKEAVKAVELILKNKNVG
ncbi:hypothetical protein ACFSSB_15375 [Lacinutrix gracilariae]|uniref:PH domain-containing protein n=1 Tax=Lacinutrix gracilariae TaxID=1747198 RepID=A0ABW5K476_9FLAO